jgi:transaldolase
MVNVGGDLAKLVPGRVSTEVDARLAYDMHGIIRKVGFFNLLLCDLLF